MKVYLSQGAHLLLSPPSVCDVCLRFACTAVHFSQSFLTIPHLFQFFIALRCSFCFSSVVMHIIYYMACNIPFCLLCMCVTVMPVLSNAGLMLRYIHSLHLRLFFSPHMPFLLSRLSFLCFSSMMSLSHCRSLLLTCSLCLFLSFFS